MIINDNSTCQPAYVILTEFKGELRRGIMLGFYFTHIYLIINILYFVITDLNVNFIKQ